jgi:hypothetical protein
MIHKTMTVAVAMAALVLGSASVASAEPLPDNCTKERGTVTCTTFEGPGKNQAGVGTTTDTQTQGNTTNKSPADQQGLQDTQTCNPPKSQGAPCP